MWQEWRTETQNSLCISRTWTTRTSSHGRWNSAALVLIQKWHCPLNKIQINFQNSRTKKQAYFQKASLSSQAAGREMKVTAYVRCGLSKTTSVVYYKWKPLYFDQGQGRTAHFFQQKKILFVMLHTYHAV